MAEEDLSALVMWALVGAIVGARGFFVLGHFSEFEGITDMLAVWRGGISLIGGILGAVIFGYPVARRRGYRFGQLMDPASIGLSFGIAVGRIGDLVIGDHLGKPTDFLLGFRYTRGTLPGPWSLDPNAGVWTGTLEDGSIQTIGRGGARLFSGTGQLIGYDPQTGARKWFARTLLRNITICPGDDPLSPYVLSLIIHEAFHLKQSIWMRLSMQGELRAWQYQKAAYRKITGCDIGDAGQAYAGTRQHWDDIARLDSDSRDDLIKAQVFTKRVSPDYRSNCLPLYPLPQEIAFYWKQKKYVEAFKAVWNLITCR